MISHPLLWIIIGGALGASLRYLTVRLVAMHVEHIFPWPTLVVNLVGCLLIGLLWGVFEVRELSHQWRNLIFIGLLGSFTTFSTFSNEVVLLLREGLYGVASLHMLLHNAGGILLTLGGYFLSRLVVSAPS